MNRRVASLAILPLLMMACSKDVLISQGPSEQVDTYQQAATPKVDVLWVIDNSVSTVDEQEKIARESQRFLETLINASIDYQLGVITTDPSERGKLRAYDGPDVDGCFSCQYVHNGIPCPNPQLINAGSTPSQIANHCPALSVFQDLVQVGTDGSALEAAFEHTLAALGFLLDPYTGLPAVDSEGQLSFAPSTFNNRFLRDDADLMLIFVSDEDESLGDTATPVRYYERLLRQRKNASGKRLTVGSIVGWQEFEADSIPPAVDGLCDYLQPVFDTNPSNHGPQAAAWQATLDAPNGCSNRDGSLAWSGFRYIELTCRMGGYLANICSSEFADTLEELANDVIRLGTEFELSLAGQIDRGSDCTLFTADDTVLDCDEDGSTSGALDGPVCVSVDGSSGQQVIARNDATGWSYNLSENTVYFQGSFEPEPGATVSIRYRVLPGQRCGMH